MRWTLLLALGVMGGLTSRARADAPEVNLLSWDEGVNVVGKPLSEASDGNWSPDQVLDELPDTGWANPRGNLTPKDLEFEMGIRSSVTRLVFDTAQTYSRQHSAKDIVVAISDKQDGPFVQILKTALAEATDGQTFVLPKPAVGRYLKLTVINNYGHPEFMEIMNFKAYGKHLAVMKTPDVSGLYSSNFNNVHILQKDNAVSGCYEHAGGLIQNAVFEGRVLRMQWSVERSGGRGTGLALLVFAEDGLSFTGHYWEGDTQRTKTPYRWDGKRISNDIGSCPYWKPDGHNEVEAQLKTEGRARLYGILFDTDSDHLKAESKSALEALLGAAKNQPTWSFAIEGHTDNAGTDAHNQELSTQRAAAVKAYLVKAGIDAARLSTQGFGATRAVGNNTTSSGRAMNRRVEIVKK